MTSDYLLPAVQLGNATRRRLGAPFLTTTPAAGQGLTLGSTSDIQQSVLVNLLKSQTPATADLTLSTTITDIPGATYTLPQSGTYIIFGLIRFAVTALGGGTNIGRLYVSGAYVGPDVNVAEPAVAGGSDTTLGVWLVTVQVPDGGGAIAKLRAAKTIAAGTAIAKADTTTLFAIRIAAS